MAVTITTSGYNRKGGLEVEALKERLRGEQLSRQTTKEELDAEMGVSLSQAYLNSAQMWGADDYTNSLSILEAERNRRRELGYKTPKLDATLSDLDKGFDAFRDSIYSEARTAVTVNGDLDTRANRDLLEMEYTPAQQLEVETEMAEQRRLEAEAKAAEQDLGISKARSDEATVAAQEATRAANDKHALDAANLAADKLESKGKLDDEAVAKLQQDASTYSRYLGYEAPITAIDNLLKGGGAGSKGFNAEDFDLYTTGISRNLVDYGEPGTEQAPGWGEVFDDLMADKYQAEVANLTLSVAPMLQYDPELMTLFKPMSDSDVAIAKVIAAGGDPGLNGPQMYQFLKRLKQSYLRMADDDFVRLKQSKLKGIESDLYEKPEKAGGYRTASGKVKTPMMSKEEFKKLSDEEQTAHLDELDAQEQDEWYAD